MSCLQSVPNSFCLPLGLPLPFSHSFCSHFLCPSSPFSPFLNIVLQSFCPSGCWTQLCPAVGLWEPAICVWHRAVPGQSSQILPGLCRDHLLTPYPRGIPTITQYMAIYFSSGIFSCYKIALQVYKIALQERGYSEW